VFGLFLDMGVGVMPASKMGSFDLSRLPMPNSGTQYYLRETLSESGEDGASAHFRITFGAFGEFRAADRLYVMPAVGWSGISMTHRNYNVVLKERGSNMEYDTKYSWGVGGNEEEYGYDSGGGDMLPNVSCRLNFRYELDSDLDLLFGLEYTHATQSTNFYGRYANVYNGNVRRSFEIKGNKMNMLGVSIGVSFK
jgi:hypothetical protein